jgi:hypothetical protein
MKDLFKEFKPQIEAIIIINIIAFTVNMLFRIVLN